MKHEADAEPVDPLSGDPRLVALFGDRFPAVMAFHDQLRDQGELRGLIGPRELGRLWERHIVNSAAVVPFLGSGSVADVGSGAGLPGMVIAAMLPERRVVLIEPMERRTQWLQEMVAHLELGNVEIVRARAEEVHDSVAVSTVTARAVAPIAKLVKWCAPLLEPGGRLVFLKGKNAEAEIESARHHLRKAGLRARVHEAETLPGGEPTRAVVVERV